ncbi:MAG: hypothetical protein LBR23_03840, partial [Spirochaetaceae bacterium]|nr:hypothetical protein [Spirochaetaceae bacterium]
MDILFDVLLPVAPKDVDYVILTVHKIEKNINPRKIIVLANRSIKNRIPQKDNVVFYDEDTLLDDLSLHHITGLVQKIAGPKSAVWGGGLFFSA